MFLRKCSVAAMFALVLGSVVYSDQPTLSVQQQAHLVLFGVEVTVVVTCPGSTSFEVNVGVRQGDMVGQSGGVNFMSDGTRQVVPVLVPGAFSTGFADATAALACSTLLEGASFGQSIKITQ